jgi:hypothetical protein
MTSKVFRKLLNERYGFVNRPQGDSNQFRAVKRKYGDYLYFQDRDMFNDWKHRYEAKDADTLEELTR